MSELEKPTERLSIRAILEGWRQPIVEYAADSGSGPSARCRVCGADYRPSPSADGRCGLCRAKGRYWTAEQLGTRAQVSVRCHWSTLDGLAGIGRKVSTPTDGWKVTLLDGDGRELWFGAGSIVVDWALPRLPEPERPMLVRGRAVDGQTKRQTAQGAPEAPGSRKVSSGGNGRAGGA